MDFKRTEEGVWCWFFVQKDKNHPLAVSPDVFIVNVTSPKGDRVSSPVVQQLPKRGMYGFNVDAKFLTEPGQYRATIGAKGIDLLPMTSTFHVVHENR